MTINPLNAEKAHLVPRDEFIAQAIAFGEPYRPVVKGNGVNGGGAFAFLPQGVLATGNPMKAHRYPSVGEAVDDLIAGGCPAVQAFA